MEKLFGTIKLLLKPLGKVLKYGLRLLGIKPVLAVAVVALLIVAALYFGPGLGLGGGAGDGRGKGNTKVQTNGEQAQLKENDTVQEVEIEPIDTKEQDDSMADTFEGTILSINVVGNDYFYDNERILLESFIAKIQEIQGKLVVEVKDDNGSLRAYNKLLSKLEERHVDYVEK